MKLSLSKKLNMLCKKLHIQQENTIRTLINTHEKKQPDVLHLLPLPVLIHIHDLDIHFNKYNISSQKLTLLNLYISYLV